MGPVLWQLSGFFSEQVADAAPFLGLGKLANDWKVQRKTHIPPPLWVLRGTLACAVTPHRLVLKAPLERLWLTFHISGSMRLLVPPWSIQGAVTPEWQWDSLPWAPTFSALATSKILSQHPKSGSLGLNLFPKSDGNKTTSVISYRPLWKVQKCSTLDLCLQQVDRERDRHENLLARQNLEKAFLLYCKVLISVWALRVWF